MKKQRRKFSKDFKLKVVLEALKERQTLSELSQKYELHPNQISTWKQAFLSKADEVFSSPSTKPAAEQIEAEKEKLYAKIGQLQMEVEFLKKKLCQ
jgi:transposase